jgi:hypothetical protein
MKLFKLVLTGTAILICILLLIIKKSNGFVQHTSTVVQTGDVETGAGNDSATDNPFNILVNLSY